VKLFFVLVWFLFIFVTPSIAEKPRVSDGSSIRVGHSQCGSTLTSREALKKLNEKAVASALMDITSGDTVIVTIFNNQSGDWTIMVDGKNGISCMVMWGRNWFNIKDEGDSL